MSQPEGRVSWLAQVMHNPPGEHLPEGLFGWILTGIGVTLATLASTVAALWKVGESKNAQAIVAQEKEIDQLREEVKSVRESLKQSEDARLECESHRASLQVKCEMIEDRLKRLENPKVV